MKKYYLITLSCLFSCTYDTISNCEVDNPSFETCITPIIENNCVACHSYGGSSSLHLNGYDDVVNAIDNYGLLIRIHADDGTVMPPSGKLSTSDLDIIERWFNAGKENN